MVSSLLMVLALVVVVAIAFGVAWGCMRDVSRHQRAKADRDICEAIWAATPDYY